ncbi:Hypothetical protein A7982_02617 [Minicystis rosea]|nr:Hypothetical protein A7982_02617 [Minicystis rosea]
MRVRQRLGLRAGLAILVTASVLLEIAFHRIFTALFGHHLALAVLPLALVGAGAGGVVLHLAPSLVRPPVVLARLGVFAALTAAATLAALLIIIHTKPIDALDITAVGRLAALSVAAALPFFFAGLTIFALLRYAARDIGRLGFAAFAAAAITGPLVIAVIRIGGPRTGLVAMILDALAALALYLAARFGSASEATPLPRAPGGVVATALLASCVLLLGDLGAPWLKIGGLRWASHDKSDAQEWTALGLLTVDKPASNAQAMRTDGTASVPMLEGKALVQVSPDELPYVLHRDGSPVAIAGAIGGRDVRIAQKLSQKQIYAIEPNAVAVRTLMRDRYRKWNGEVLEKPEIQDVAVEDPRGYLQRAPLRFRTIVIPLPDTQTPASLGALAAEPNHMYTVEGLREALDRLTPDGAVLVSRFDGDVDRLFVLAATALRAAGIDDPAQHVYACGTTRSTSVLITRAPISARDVGQLRSHCRKNKHTEAFAPGDPHGELRRRIMSAPDPAAEVAAEGVDLTPPTDDRPYYFASLSRRLLGATLGNLKVLQTSHQALLVLAASAVLAAGAWALGLILPALRRPRERERGARLAPLGYFSAATAALVLAFAAFAARLPLLLGHPGTRSPRCRWRSSRSRARAASSPRACLSSTPSAPRATARRSWWPRWRSPPWPSARSWQQGSHCRSARASRSPSCCSRPSACSSARCLRSASSSWHRARPSSSRGRSAPARSRERSPPWWACCSP